MRIALGYGRKSVVRRESDTVSVDKQRLALSELADRRGEQIEWYEDAEGHRSGRYERTRPGYQRLLARLKDDSVSRPTSVLFYELDRAGRSVILIDQIIKLCKAKGIAFVCLKEGIDTDRTGFGANEVTRIQLLAVLAEGEASRVAERMEDTARYYRETLRIPWGMWPFGFDRTGEGESARFLPLPPHDETVRKLMTLYTSGNGYREVAHQLNALGFRHIGRYGQEKDFGGETVRTITGNVLFYAGLACGIKQHAKQAHVSLVGEGTYLERYARALKAERAPAITPLIDPETASAVIERRFKMQTAGRRPGGWVSLLTPILYWNGQKLWAQSRESGHYYRTRSRAGVRLDADAIDAEVLRRLRGVQFPPTVRADVRAAIEERIGASQRAELALRQAKASGEMELLIDLLRDGMIDRGVYNKRYTAVEAQLHEVKARMNAPDEVDGVMSALNDLAGALDRLPATKRKLAVQKMFERVDVDDQGSVTRVMLRGWARDAFMQAVSIMPPVSDGHAEDTRWLLDHAA